MSEPLFVDILAYAGKVKVMRDTQTLYFKLRAEARKDPSLKSKAQGVLIRSKQLEKEVDQLTKTILDHGK